MVVASASFNFFLGLCFLAIGVNGTGFVNLQQARVSEAYRTQLEKSFDRFKSWAVMHNRGIPEDYETDVEGMNELLVDHIQFLYENQFGVSAARHILLAIQKRFKLLRPFLSEAWDSVKSWEQRAPVSLRLPVPPLVRDALFSFAMLKGFNSSGTEARDWLTFGVGILVCFEALLRPCEWTELIAQRVAVPGRRIQSLLHNGLLTIVNGKNRRVFGRVQVAILEDPRTLAWITWLVTDMNPGVKLFHGGTAKFRRLFKLALKALSIPLKLTPAGLRAGGATAKFASGLFDIGKLKFRGRWASMHTLEHYLQEATAELIVMDLEDSLTRKLLQIQHHSAVFDQPPPQPWHAFFPRPIPRNRWTARDSTGRFASRKVSKSRQVSGPGSRLA